MGNFDGTKSCVMSCNYFGTRDVYVVYVSFLYNKIYVILLVFQYVAFLDIKFVFCLFMLLVFVNIYQDIYIYSCFFFLHYFFVIIVFFPCFFC